MQMNACSPVSQDRLDWATSVVQGRRQTGPKKANQREVYRRLSTADSWRWARDGWVQSASPRAANDAAWFSVLKDKTGQLFLHDFKRYEALLPTQPVSCYPQLMTLFGHDMQAQIAIVQGIIALGARTGQALPEIGPRGQNLSHCNGAVNLFLDPSTSSTDTPMLLATCCIAQGMLQ
ncbi:hypothetical protein ANO11243_068000 [Dothideomycetidae sp. 11243]|nr:hypothetical protein ANO11243_068000 [fungal sp. No.11243]